MRTYREKLRGHQCFLASGSCLTFLRIHILHLCLHCIYQILSFSFFIVSFHYYCCHLLCLGGIFSHPNRRSKDRGSHILYGLWNPLRKICDLVLHKQNRRWHWQKLVSASRETDNIRYICCHMIKRIPPVSVLLLLKDHTFLGWLNNTSVLVFWCLVNCKNTLSSSRKEAVFVSSWKVSIIIIVFIQHIYNLSIVLSSWFTML